MINIGRLDKRIQLQKQADIDTRDAFGAVNFTSNWSDVGYRYADVVELDGTESNKDGKEVGIKKVKFTIRYEDNIGIHSHRIQYDGRTFDILSIVPTNKNRKDGLSILTEEII
jgi:SPP1 family predicted phage head-tail adaptor